MVLKRIIFIILLLIYFLYFYILFYRTVNLHKIATLLENKLKFISKVDLRKMITERNRVIYLYGTYPTSEFATIKYEIQFWPSVLYHCFEYEHNTIYKSLVQPDESALEKSKLLREREHQLQDLIDMQVIIPNV